MHYHFIGIGGIGMGKLASLLLARGEDVSGSDISESAMTRSLRAQGARIMIGHDAANVGEAPCVVYSSAIRPNNPEIIAARQGGRRLIRRAELLADLMRDAFAVTVAGAHGKTTTTSMIAHMMTAAGLDPTVALGGVFTRGSYQEQLGQSGYFVAELDESDGSFLFFSPRLSVITNIDFEHVDYYGTWEKIVSAYACFAAQTRSDGLVIACGDDSRLKEIIQCSGKAAVYYGFGSANDFRAADVRVENGRTVFTCFSGGQPLGDVSLAVPGSHNVLNSLACAAAGLHLDLSFETVRQALGSYEGVKRRLEQKGTWGNVRLVDDYAHHPTEIRAVLSALRASNPGRIVAVFQPHRYTRVQHLWEEFRCALAEADVLIVTDIYAASEDPISGVDSPSLIRNLSLRSGGRACYALKEDLASLVAQTVQPGDCVVTMGAGDITRISDDLMRLLEDRLAVNHG